GDNRNRNGGGKRNRDQVGQDRPASRTRTLFRLEIAAALEQGDVPPGTRNRAATIAEDSCDVSGPLCGGTMSATRRSPGVRRCAISSPRHRCASAVDLKFLSAVQQMLS